MGKKVTIEQVMDWRPCYTREQVDELFDGRDLLEWRDIAALPISAEHRSWALIHEEFFPRRQLYLLGADIAELVLPNYEERYPGDHRPRNAIEAARQFARGEIDEYQLDNARSASLFAEKSVAWSDARFAAWSAAWSAVRSTNSDAAWLAARFASCSAASSAAWSASWFSAWEQILQIICNHLEE